MNHLAPEDVERFADGEITDSAIEQHLLECARCSMAVLQVVQMKRAIHEAIRDEAPPAALRRRVSARESLPAWWVAVAAIIVLVLITGLLTRTRTPSALPELVDMHVTLLASVNPVDVVSTDRHTVKPWFEGRLPFTVPVPDLAATPFRLIGGRVVYWRANPAAYLLIGKAAHRISVFVFRDDLAPRDLRDVPSGVSTSVWRARGLTFVAIGQVTREDLQQLQAA
ncbi:MAG: hypothetical protein DMF59_16845, partial [Acidobacteria bacterium]